MIIFKVFITLLFFSSVAFCETESKETIVDTLIEATAASDGTIEQEQKLSIPIHKAHTASFELNLNKAPFGWYGGGVDLGVASFLTIGPKFYYLSKGAITELLRQPTPRGFVSTLHGTFYLNGRKFEDGFIVRPGIGYGSWHVVHSAKSQIVNDIDLMISSLLKTAPDPIEVRTQIQGIVGELHAGYQVVLPVGLSFSATIGGSFFQQEVKAVAMKSGKVTTLEPSKIKIAPEFELNVGWVL